jgi:translation initiation factor RLI1
MPKQVAAVDYQGCHPERCDHGLCLAVVACEYGSLIQESPYEFPEIDPGKWCHGCAKCAQACPLKAIQMV